MDWDSQKCRHYPNAWALPDDSEREPIRAEHNSPVSAGVSQKEPATDRSRQSIDLDSQTMTEINSKQVASNSGASIEAMLAGQH